MNTVLYSPTTSQCNGYNDEFYSSKNHCSQRPQPVQIICICPDICAFSVLHHRHLSDICAFCQKCQFEGKKGWQVLLLQSKAEDMHCKQADSAILKLLLVQGSMGQIYFITKQTYVVITCFCRNMGYVAFTRILSRIAFCHEYALFWFCFVQTFTQTFRIWLRFCADIWTKNWRLRPLTTRLIKPSALLPLPGDQALRRGKPPALWQRGRRNSADTGQAPHFSSHQ